jgi:hypothetical protein
MNDQQLNKFILFFNRLPGEWWLAGETLIHWITHRELKFFDYVPSAKEPGSFVPDYGIHVSCNKTTLYRYCASRNVSFLHHSADDWDGTIDYVYMNFCGFAFAVKFNQKITKDIQAPEEERAKLKRRKDLGGNGFWQRHIDPVKPFKVQLPFKYGTILDQLKPLWWKDNDHSNYTPRNVWFTPERKRNGYELLSLMLNCGEKAGIRSSMFLGFGNLLGYVMFGDFIKDDTDLDLCIDSERHGPEGDKKYLEEIKKPFKINGQNFPHGLTEKMFRFSTNRGDTNRPLWISIGHRSIEHDFGVKSCNWFMFEHSNHHWHSKGERWVSPGKFNNSQISSTDKAICLGQPSGTLEQFIEVDFNGVAGLQMPILAGTCLDWWYIGWKPDGSGSSSRNLIMTIPDWNKKSTWRMF